MPRLMPPFLLGAALSAASFVHAGTETTVLRSDFTGDAPGLATPWTATSVLDPNLTFTGWDLGAGATGLDGGIDDALGFTVTAPGHETSLAEALATDAYLTATIDPAAPIDLNGAKLEFQVQRHSWHAARRYALFTSVDGFAEADVIFTSARIESGDESLHTISAFLPALGYGAITEPLELRLYGYEATFGGHATSLAGFGVITGVETVSLTVNHGAGGTAHAVPDRVIFELGETVQLHAAPDPGHRFAGWTGDVGGFGNPRTITLTADTAVTGSFAPLAAPAMEVGVNPDGVVDWASSWIFANAFDRTRTWRSRATDGSGAWDGGHGGSAPSDPDGWPTAVPFDPGNGDPPQWLHTVLVTPNGAGDYVFSWSGAFSGRFRADGSPWVTITPGMNEVAFTVASRNESLWLEVHATSAPDHLRDVRIARAEHLPVPPTFEPAFLDRIDDFGVLRFMDWANTNGSWVQQWSQRTAPTAYTHAQSAGVAYERMIELANTVQQDAWFCVPHQADDTFVRELARLIRDQLDPALKAYVEYSNETWNSAGPFSQTIWVQDQGEALGLSANRWEAGQRFVVLRSVQIFSLFEEEFGAAADRLVHVLATHSANIHTTNLRIAALNDPAINPDAVWPDALAIAPYFGRTFAPSDVPPHAPAYPTIDEILDVMTPLELDEARDHVRAQKAVANAQGLDLICYEAGQHYVGIGGAENDDVLTQLLHDVNRDPRMGDHYRTYLDLLRDEGVTVCAIFTLCSHWSKWGSWGALEYLEQPDDDAPKYRALIEWISQACPSDLDGDGAVGFTDLVALLGAWGPCPAPCPGDFDQSGAIDFADLLHVLGDWGTC